MSTRWDWDKADKSERVAVIGCGPAGLLAAWAAVRAGFQVEIFGPKMPSVQTGAQYIHHEIPGIVSEDESQPVMYSHIGSPEIYAWKIYGEQLEPKDTSWFKFSGAVPAWSMSEVYGRLWRYFEDVIIDCHVDLGRLEQIARHNLVVFSSMPLNRLLDPDNKNQDAFKKQSVLCYPKMITPNYGIKVDLPNSIVYNGWTLAKWYRQSRIFGREWTEWPFSVGIDGVEQEVIRYGHTWNSSLLWPVMKPLACDLQLNLHLPPNVRLVGRYGQWRKGVLAHDAYLETKEYLEICGNLRSANM